MGKFIDLTGQRFGRLTAVKRTKNRGNRTTWLCECDCGALKEVGASNLINEHASSCGCFKLEYITKAKTTHGHAGTRLYHTWKHMVQRCTNPNDKQYADYGGRGIKLYPQWREFTNFLKWATENGYSKDLTIDRINNNGNYEPSNCRWATPIQQARNKRNNRLIAYEGQTKTLAEWAEERGIKPHTILRRIRFGWKIEDALNIPLRGAYGIARGISYAGS